jgi:RND family efflux transporter MFP subunit
MHHKVLFRVLAGVVLLAGGGGAWWLATRPPAVVVTSPGRGPAVEAIYATGTVEPVRWVKVGPTVPGRIEIFDCVEGAPVAGGQVLMRLEDRTQRARLAELEAAMRFKELELERYRTLLKNDFASRQAYERARSDLDQAQAAVEAARQALTDMTVRAPFDGVVLREDGEAGEVVKAGDALCWIGDPTRLRITAEIDEEDMPRIAVGQRTLLKADAYPGRSLDGRIDDITPQGDPVNKTYRARIALPADTPLLVGMTVEVNVIIRDTADAILVPPAALREGVVWVVEDGVARRRAVEIGVFGDDQVEILSGLDGDEILIVDPPNRLADGDAVRPRQG